MLVLIIVRSKDCSHLHGGPHQVDDNLFLGPVHLPFSYARALVVLGHEVPDCLTDGPFLARSSDISFHRLLEETNKVQSRGWLFLSCFLPQTWAGTHGCKWN